MENNETCIHGGVSPISLLAELHHSQAGSGRHRCPTCAYEQGFNLGSSGNWHSYDEYCNTLKDPKVVKLGQLHLLIFYQTLATIKGVLVDTSAQTVLLNKVLKLVF